MLWKLLDREKKIVLKPKKEKRTAASKLILSRRTFFKTVALSASVVGSLGTLHAV